MDEPVFIALLFADRVIEETNHKKGIIGTFTTFNADTFPAIFAPWYIYAAVTNLKEEEKHTFTINIAHREDQHVAFSTGGDLQVGSRNTVAELVAPVINAAFIKAGIHVVTFTLSN